MGYIPYEGKDLGSENSILRAPRVSATASFTEETFDGYDWPSPPGNNDQLGHDVEHKQYQIPEISHRNPEDWKGKPCIYMYKQNELVD